ncbi:unnamed protein product [Clonostachys rosea]|uniref:Uncharacterized protein n=1 Tax=Bionectria ochroleuca TaxID=29856 RepID=A0ABY6UT13_BIOOC|nr:unnamed protein product [Clonostachys rosea]
MKCIFAVALLFAVVSALKYPIFSSSSASNKIPQFILDLNNDCIEANRHILELQGNPKEALCHRESPLRDSLPFQVPDDFFHELFIDNTRFSTPRKGWQNAKDRLSEILDCPAALESCTRFHVDIYRHKYDGPEEGPGSANSTAASGSIIIHPNVTMNNRYMGASIAPIDTSHDLGEQADAPTTLVDLFVSVLTSMPNLQTVEWKGPEGTGQGEHFEKMFTERQLALPTVKNMHLRSNFIFLAATAPSLESLTYIPALSPRQSQERYRKQVLEIISDLPSLKSVRLHSSWDERDFLELYKAAPRLERLEIDGTVDLVDLSAIWWRGKKSLRPEGYKLKARMYIGPLEGYHWAYEGVLGAKFGRYEAFGHLHKTEQAARIVLEELPNLERLCIGGICTDLTDEKSLQWPWSGRVREYLLSKYSRWYSEDDGKVLVEDPDGPIFFTRQEDETWLEASEKPGGLEFIIPDRVSWLAWDDRHSCVGSIQ